MEPETARFGDLVLINDHQVIACNKPGGIPVQEDRTGSASLHRMAQAYCKRDLFVVHRIDRPCSGIVLFAKNRESAAHLGEQFASNAIRKTYFAVIGKGLEPPEGELVHMLGRGHSNRTVLADASAGGKRSVLRYQTIGEIDNYSLLAVYPETGRTHQIRAQLAICGHPIRGDVKYGFKRGNRDRSIHLHARALSFAHPTKRELVELAAPVPDDPVWNAFEI